MSGLVSPSGTPGLNECHSDSSGVPRLLRGTKGLTGPTLRPACAGRAPSHCRRRRRGSGALDQVEARAAAAGRGLHLQRIDETLRETPPTTPPKRLTEGLTLRV